MRGVCGTEFGERYGKMVVRDLAYGKKRLRYGTVAVGNSANGTDFSERYGIVAVRSSVNGTVFGKRYGKVAVRN